MSPFPIPPIDGALHVVADKMPRRKRAITLERVLRACPAAGAGGNGDCAAIKCHYK